MAVPTTYPLLKFEEHIRLLSLAHDQGVEIEPHPTRPGVYLATSGTGRRYSDGGTVKYTVTTDGCSCPAGSNGRHCKHYALGLQTMWQEGVNGIEIGHWEMELWVMQRRVLPVTIADDAPEIHVHRPIA